MTTMAVSSKTLRSTLFFLSILFLCFSLILAHGGSDDGDDEDEEATTANQPPPATGTVVVDLRSKSLVLVKIYCLIILFFSTFLAGVSPYFYRWNESFLLLGTQFSGGIFLATALVHFLSDANETFRALKHKEYPYAFMLAAGGYCLTMLADVAAGFVAVGINSNHSRTVAGESRLDDDVPVKEEGRREIGSDADVNQAIVRTSGFGDTALLILALCFHSIFEGIAIGVSDNKSDAWRNLWTISMHKIFAAVAMGIALLKLIPKRPFFLTVAYSFAFGISSPIGVGIGIGINSTSQGAASDWIYAITMSLACGVFVYVAVNHLISKGYKPRDECYFDKPIYKFLAVFLGVVLLSIVMIWD